MILYGQAPTAGLPRAWACNQCHSTGPGNPPTPLTDSHTRGTPPEPVLIRAAPRDPGYIQLMMHAQPEVAPVIAAMEACIIQGTITPCLADRPPNNVMGDLGDIAEFLYTCDLGLAPCVAGGGTGGGGGGPTQGELQASGTLDFGNQAIASASAPLTLTLTNVGNGTVNVSGVTNSNPAEFAITANNCTALSQSTSCGITVTFTPAATGARSAVVTVTSNGQFSPQAFIFSGTGTPASAANHEGLWWNPNEDGWGINLEHQGNVIFATWFTYDLTGKAWWLVMIAYAGPGNTYTGSIYTTTGSSYLLPTFTKGTVAEAGTGTLTFVDAGHATFEYNLISGAHQMKSIVPQVFGPLPTCTYGTPANLAGTTNYQGMWWNANEDGWGINFSHQGSTLFASWFTYDTSGAPLWLVSIMQKGTGETFSGELLRMTATPFNAVPFARNTPVSVGSATLSFTNGNTGTFQYTIGANAPITKQLTHQPLGAVTAGTVCH